MVGGLAGVMVSLMGTRRCSPTQDVQGGERLVFEVLVNKLARLFQCRVPDEWDSAKPSCQYQKL